MITISLDENGIEQAISKHVADIAGKVMSTLQYDPNYIFHTTKQVAERLGCSEDTIRKYINEGKKNLSNQMIKLRTTDLVASEYRISEADLREFIDCFKTNNAGLKARH